jgi:hypothetical protein
MGETLYFLWGYDVLNPGMVATIECLASRFIHIHQSFFLSL